LVEVTLRHMKKKYKICLNFKWPSSKGPIPRLRISISIRIAYADKKWNTLNNVGAILVYRISIRIIFVRKQCAHRIAQ